jgi:hypothetical protein
MSPLNLFSVYYSIFEIKNQVTLPFFQILICRAQCSHEPSDCFAPLFQKRSPRGVSAKNSVSFCELFLCAFFVKEKVDNRQEVAIVCGTNFRYQNSLAAFLCQKGPKEKLWKRKGRIQGLRALDRATARGAPPLKRWTKQSHKASDNIAINPNFAFERAHGVSPYIVGALRRISF